MERSGKKCIEFLAIRRKDMTALEDDKSLGMLAVPGRFQRPEDKDIRHTVLEALREKVLTGPNGEPPSPLSNEANELLQKETLCLRLYSNDVSAREQRELPSLVADGIQRLMCHFSPHST
jgi:hypothetical protein